MKKILFITFILLFNIHAGAETGYKKGKIEYIRTHDAEIFPQWSSPRFWFTLKEVSSAGSCTRWRGNVLFVMNSKDALSIILSSQMADKEISVYFDDTKNYQGYCKAGYITTGNPPPL